MPSQYRTFRERFCERFTCSPAAYEFTVLLELLHPVPRLIARLILPLRPHFFETDRTIVRRVSYLDTVPEVLAAAQDLHKEYAVRSDNGPLRRIFRIHLSRERLLKLTAHLWKTRYLVAISGFPDLMA